MNMITYFNELVTKNFNNYLKKYFNNMNYTEKNGNFINYYNFINDLDLFNDSFIKDIIKGYFEYIDECFFQSSYRRNFCKSNGFYERKNYVTLFGEINFKRRYYYDKNTGTGDILPPQTGFEPNTLNNTNVENIAIYKKEEE